MARVWSDENTKTACKTATNADFGNLLREYAMTKLCAHANVNEVLSLDLDEEYLAIKMTHHTCTLWEYAATHFTADHYETIVPDIIRGLAYIHWCGIVHHDISVNNIFITKDKRAVIGDFGESLLQAEHKHPLYVHPINIPNFDEKSCVYGVGIDIFLLEVTLKSIPTRHRKKFTNLYRSMTDYTPAAEILQSVTGEVVPYRPELRLNDDVATFRALVEHFGQTAEGVVMAQLLLGGQESLAENSINRKSLTDLAIAQLIPIDFIR